MNEEAKIQIVKETILKRIKDSYFGELNIEFEEYKVLVNIDQFIDIINNFEKDKVLTILNQRYDYETEKFIKEHDNYSYKRNVFTVKIIGKKIFPSPAPYYNSTLNLAQSYKPPILHEISNTSLNPTF